LNIGKAIDKLYGNERISIGNRSGAMNNAEKSLAQSFVKGSVGFKVYFTETKGETKWEGWGTALKPAHEPAVLARKPLAEKNVARNVLEFGTGGVNVDGCRVEHDETIRRSGLRADIRGGNFVGTKKKIDLGEFTNTQGRWPANVILEDCEVVKGMFPETSSGGGVKNPECGVSSAFISNHHKASAPFSCDSGSASRYFYCAKASKKDRDEGLEGFEKKKAGEMKGRNNGSLKDSMPVIAKNHHPTVKPTDLMMYLCRLITPPKGIILDPFMGSGSTGKAAIKEGFRFIGIEKEAEYFEISKARIAHAADPGELFRKLAN
jgi:site-specific DNA-methyltransferase (adenine-specific)